MAKAKEMDNEKKQEETPDIENSEETEQAQECGEAESREEDSPLDKALKEKEAYLNALMRERADFENFKKRNAIATARAYTDGRIDAVTAILPVIDNLERAVASTGEESAIKEGVEMVLRQMTDVLKSLDVEEIAAQGEKFDPNLHNAVMQEDGEDGEESDTVKEVLMKGYKTKDKVLRHSMVKVVK